MNWWLVQYIWVTENMYDFITAAAISFSHNAIFSMHHLRPMNFIARSVPADSDYIYYLFLHFMLSLKPPLEELELPNFFFYYKISSSVNLHN